MNLKGKHILIIGASSGIGISMVSYLESQGAELTLTSTNLDKLQDFNHPKIELDVFLEDSIKLLDDVKPLDGVVYTPGIVKLSPVKYINQKHLDEVRIPIFDGAVKCMSFLIQKKKLKKGSSLVFTSSISSSFPYKGGAVYTSSKAALETYSKVLAIELAADGIRSNCIKAGLVATKILEETKANMPDEVFDNHVDQYPLGIGETIDVAKAVGFLLSDDSKWITGTEIVLDGGLTAGA
jgi:NAD(P)-dependent dehydrogenase (short-subunit alcohol dehydrogenase family)